MLEAILQELLVHILKSSSCHLPAASQNQTQATVMDTSAFQSPYVHKIEDTDHATHQLPFLSQRATVVT